MAMKRGKTKNSKKNSKKRATSAVSLPSLPLSRGHWNFKKLKMMAAEVIRVLVLGHGATAANRS